MALGEVVGWVADVLLSGLVRQHVQQCVCVCGDAGEETPSNYTLCAPPATFSLPFFFPPGLLHLPTGKQKEEEEQGKWKKKNKNGAKTDGNSMNMNEMDKGRKEETRGRYIWVRPRGGEGEGV